MSEIAALLSEASLAGDDVNRQIDRGSKGRVRALAEFAERYARDPAFHDEAILLGIESPATEEELRERMRLLVSRILSDLESTQGASAPTAGEREEKDERLARWLQRKEAELKPAFIGHDLTKQYGPTGFRLESLDLSLRPGEVTGVVGQNAQGKTTLLRIIAGETKPDTGTIAYPALGQPGPSVDWFAVKKRIAFVPQDLPRWRGGLAETLHFEAALHGVKPSDNDVEVGFVIERLDLGPHLDKRWEELSGGYRLRFALARALVWKPQLLVLDEPLANLDLKAKELLLQDVSQLARSFHYPIAVIMSSHELYGLERVCAQMVFMKKGRATYVGPPDGVEAATMKYELGTGLSAERLRKTLKGTGVLELKDDGGQFTVTTEPALDARAFLQLLFDRKVPVSHFRDVSRSVRRLFD